jgi:hypothetical protein
MEGDDMEDDGVAVDVDEDDFNCEVAIPADGGINYCDDDCDCDAIDNINYGGHDLMKYMDWGDCDITESGREVLRFLSTIVKGKSMSRNKAEDLLRYESMRLLFIGVPVYDVYVLVL